MTLFKALVWRLTTVIAVALVPTSYAHACVYKRGSDVNTIKAEMIRGKKKVIGSLKITQVQSYQEGAGSEVRKYLGVVKDAKGRHFNVLYQDGGFLRLCVPTVLPSTDVEGTFYLKRNRSKSYELIHWEDRYLVEPTPSEIESE